MTASATESSSATVSGEAPLPTRSGAPGTASRTRLRSLIGVGSPVATPETTQAVAGLINRHPDRFLFGTDEVAPSEQTKYLKVYDLYAPLFAGLTPEASEKLRKRNYERLFDEARRRVRAWEKANVKPRS